MSTSQNVGAAIPSLIGMCYVILLLLLLVSFEMLIDERCG